MTQQPYAPAGYPPQYPQAPAPPNQTYPPQQPPYAAPAPTYPQQPYAQPGYPPQTYGQPYPQQGPPAPPPVPLAEGSLDAFYNQPSAGTGPSIGWSDKAGNQRPVGTTWVGIVTRDVTNSDVQQQTDIKTGAPQYFRDGRPKFAMRVPLKNVALFDPQGQQLQTPELTEGEGTWFCKGQARDELNRAMAEAGVSGAPKAGAVVAITLVNRRANGGGMNPTNVVQIRYQPGESGQGAIQAPEQPPAAPVQQAPQQPTQQQQQWAQPQPQQPAPPQAPQYAPPTQYGPPQGVPPQQLPPQAPVQQQAAPVPAGFDQEQQALFARITGGQPPQQAAS